MIQCLIFIKGKRGGDDWIFQFRRQLFAWEEDELSNLTVYLHVAPSLTNQVKDYCTWLANPSGFFSVASLWSWMASSKGPNIRLVGNIWNNIAPPKVQFMTWLAWKGRMKSVVFMQWIGVLKPNANILCVFCKSKVETQTHLLLHCSCIWKVWSGIMGWWGLCWAIPGSVQSLLSWGDGFKVRKVLKIWKIVPMAVLWSVWKLRNECLFNNAQPDFVNLEDLVKVRVALWTESNMKNFHYSLMADLLLSVTLGS